MVDATPTKPFCFADPSWFYRTSTCDDCAFWLACGAMVDWPQCATLTRKVFVETLARVNLPRDDAIAAIQKAYGITHNAARLQYDRWRKKLGNPQ